MSRGKRRVLVGVLLLLATGLAATLLLPGLITERARQWVAAETGRSLEIGSLSINPLSLSVEIRDLALSERDPAQTFIAWDSLTIAISPRSLYHRAPIVRELQLVRPRIRVERNREQFNFSDLLPPADPEAPASDGEPARFSLNNLTIIDGRVEILDHTPDGETHHVIDEINLGLPFLGNLPYLVEQPVTPHLQAVVNDAPLELKGEFKPFASGQEMRVKLALDDIDLPFYLGYLPVELPVELLSGRLNCDLDLSYRASAAAEPELQLQGKLALVSLNIHDRRAEQLFFLPLLQVEIAPSRPLAKQIHLNDLRIYNLEVQLNRDQQGAWNHARLKDPASAAEPEPAAAPAEPPLQLTIDTFQVRDGVLVFRDDLPTGGFASLVRDINLDISNFSLAPGARMPLNLALATERHEQLKVHGEFGLSPFNLDLAVAAGNISLAPYEPYYHQAYKVPLQGVLEAQARLAITPEQPLLVSAGQVRLRDLYGPFNADEGFGAGLAEIRDLSFDLAANRLEIGATRWVDGRVNFSRDPAGRWSFLSRNFPILAKLAEAGDAPAAPAATPAPGPPFSYRIDALTLTDWAVDFTDHRPATPAHLVVDNLNLELRNLTAPERVESPVDFSATLLRKGRIELQGELTLADPAARLDLRVRKLPLAELSPYLAEQANLLLTDGALDARLKVAVTPGAAGPEALVSGDLGVSRFYLLDGRHREDLVKWDSLQIAGIEAGTAPQHLTIASITLSDYFAKMLIDDEARLNLIEVLHKPPPDPTATEPVAASVPAEAEPGGTERPAVRIDRVVLQGGRLDFSDRHLPQPFHADMRELGGSISGLSSDPAARATVDLRGALRNQSPLTISGTLNPLADPLYLDIELNFNDIELSPLSPYSGTYVGYLIEKGKLNIALDYRIEDDRLKAGNRLFLDQFTFGEAVESEQATSLPVKLAVALLTDRKGEIHLDIPVSGSLDDPEFRIGSVIWTVIRNLLVKAATSPMALLGAVIGGGSEADFSIVAFAPGTATLSAAEQAKLEQVAKALRDRPTLAVEIKGFIDPEQDPEGYRHELLRRQVQRAKYLDLVAEQKLPAGETGEQVELAGEEYEEYLWRVYKQADFPKPRNFIGLTKHLPAAELEKLIYANTAVGPHDLAELAQARAQAVQQFLVDPGGLGPERIFLARPDIESPPSQENAPRSRVEFGVTVR